VPSGTATARPKTASLDYGPEPLGYDVRLELDGRRYRAEATAPADIEQRDGHAQVTLTFDRRCRPSPDSP
jgi:hypothetical protein